MKLAVKILSVAVLIALASPVILLKGCGTKLCGGCPSDSIAPSGSSVAVVSSMADQAVPVLGGCFSNIIFTFTGPDSSLLNGICVELITNGYIQKSSGDGTCSNNTGYVPGYIRTRTDAGGTATVDFSTADLTAICTANPGTTQTLTYFVTATSCTVSETTSATLTLTCP